MDSKKAAHVIAKVREKQGEISIDDIQTQFQKQLRGEAKRDILNTFLLSAGVAGTARGGQGLWNLLIRGRNKLRSRPGVAPLPVPYRPSFRNEEEEKEAQFPREQPKVVPGSGPTSKPGLGWYMPAMLGAGALGGLGGWKLIDQILDRRRRKEIDDEVNESRNEFQEALMSQYKQGSDSELGVALDELYLKMQKSAKVGDLLDPRTYLSDDSMGRIAGGYATYAIPSSILGYLFVKGLTDKGSRGRILEKAQRRRALKQQQARPAELYAIPTPIEKEEE